METTDEQVRKLLNGYTAAALETAAGLVRLGRMHTVVLAYDYGHGPNSSVMGTPETVAALCHAVGLEAASDMEADE